MISHKLLLKILNSIKQLLSNGCLSSTYLLNHRSDENLTSPNNYKKLFHCTVDGDRQTSQLDGAISIKLDIKPNSPNSFQGKSVEIKWEETITDLETTVYMTKRFYSILNS